MVAPVTGPFSTHEYILRGPTSLGATPVIYERDRTWYRQKPPFSLPLNFTYSERRVNVATQTFSHIGNPDSYYESTSATPAYVDVVPNLYNQAYAKFKEKLGAAVEGGVATAEGKQAMEMVENRLRQMWAFGRALRTGRFGDAANLLGFSLSKKEIKSMRRNPRTFRFTRNPITGKRLRKRPSRTLEDDIREDAKGFANLYLEFHFGWTPLVNDIYDALEVVCEPLMPHHVKVRVRRSYGSPVTSFSDNGTDKTYTTRTTTIDQTVSLAANLEVVNPNIGLLQQVGLANPLTIAWELIPFSFIGDWFVNVGDFLSSFTDFAGVSLTFPQRTIFTRWRDNLSEAVLYNYASPVESGPPYYYNFQRYSSSKVYQLAGTYVQRIVGPFPGPTLAVRDPWSLSPRRGLAAASLLVQQFAGIRKTEKRPSWVV